MKSSLKTSFLDEYSFISLKKCTKIYLENYLSRKTLIKAENCFLVNYISNYKFVSLKIQVIYREFNKSLYLLLRSVSKTSFPLTLGFSQKVLCCTFVAQFMFSSLPYAIFINASPLLSVPLCLLPPSSVLCLCFSTSLWALPFRFEMKFWARCSMTRHILSNWRRTQ